jgi:hypothetical protein
MVFSGYSVIQTHGEQQRETIAGLQLRSDNIVRTVDQRLSVVVSSLASLAEADAAKDSNWPRLYEQAQRVLLRGKDYRAATLISRDGQVLFHTRAPYGSSLFRASQPEMVEEVFATGRWNVSGAFVAPISPKPVVAVSVPVFQGGEVRYVLRAIVLVDSMNQLLLDAALPEGWIAAITDRQGRIVARTHQPDKFVGQTASADFLAALRNKNFRPFVAVTREGIHATGLTQPVKGADWYVGIAVPDQILNQAMNDELRSLAGLVVAWLLLSLLLSQALAALLHKQARGLVAAVSSPESGSTTPRALWVAEFNAMRDSVFSARREQVATTAALGVAMFQRDEVRDLYDLAPCGYHSLDATGRVTRMNQTELDWLGLSWQEVSEPERHLICAAGCASRG